MIPSTKTDLIRKNDVGKYAVIAIFLGSLCHFLILLNGIVVQALQLDFSSLYVTGLALNHGLNPYVNHVAENHDLWDGFSIYRPSKFLYPPLAGLIFQGLALFSYATAKEIWSMVIILCVIFSIALQSEAMGYQLSRKVWLLIVSAILLFFPLIAELQCGQIDALCLLWLSMSVYYLIRDKPKPILAGIFIALASLFKLHCGLILVYLLLKQKYRASLGFVAGWIAIAICSIAIEGWPLQKQYLTVEMPRISHYACYGDELIRIDPLIININFQGVKFGSTRVQGEVYTITALRFSPFSGIPYYLKLLLQPKFSFGLWALITSFFFFCLVAWHELVLGSKAEKNGDLLSDYIFLQVSFLAVLLSAPLTWVMNSVWLVPLIPFCVFYFAKIKTRHDGIGWILLMTGLIIIGFPDETGSLHQVDLPYVFYMLKPILGELLCFTGLLRLYDVARLVAASEPPAPDQRPN